jgi:hypothetical protein
LIKNLELGNSRREHMTIKNEKKFKKMEEERPDEMEMAKKKNE